MDEISTGSGGDVIVTAPGAITVGQRPDLSFYDSLVKGGVIALVDGPDDALYVPVLLFGSELVGAGLLFAIYRRQGFALLLAGWRTTGNLDPGTSLAPDALKVPPQRVTNIYGWRGEG